MSKSKKEELNPPVAGVPVDTVALQFGTHLLEQLATLEEGKSYLVTFHYSRMQDGRHVIDGLSASYRKRT